MQLTTYKKIHVFFALTFIAPMVVIFSSGFALLIKSFFPGIQPVVVETTNIPGKPLLSLEDLKKDPQVEQIIYRPDKNNISIRYKDDIEKQIHAQTGEVLSYAKRHTNWIIRIHQGTYFADWVKQFIFIPTAVALQVLWITGLVLYFKTKKWRRSVKHEPI